MGQDFSKTIFANILLKRLGEILSDYETKYQILLEEIKSTPDLCISLNFFA